MRRVASRQTRNISRKDAEHAKTVSCVSKLRAFATWREQFRLPAASARSFAQVSKSPLLWFNQSLPNETRKIPATTSAAPAILRGVTLSIWRAIKGVSNRTKTA